MRRLPQYFSPSKQKGAAAIEFALVFAVFFAVFYGLVTYSLPLLLMQSFNAAASEAVRQSVAISPSANNYASLVTAQAKSVLTTQLSWIPPAFGFSDSDSNVTYTNGLLTVRIDYPKTKLTNVMPVLSLPGVGNVPNLPDKLSAQASLQLVP